MHFTPTTIQDLPTIRELFAAAIEYQQKKTSNPWHGLNETNLIREIGERLNWKVMEGDQIAAFFSIAFTDPLIWDERDADPAIYLHRIVTNPAFRGRGYVRVITAWAEDYGREAGKAFVRLDTGRENTRLNAYYRECGYSYCGHKTFHDADNPNIPKHYFGPGLSLYEKPIGPVAGNRR